MTPMREAFVTVLHMLERRNAPHRRAAINDALTLLIEHARDPEEAGAAAQFAAAALLYLDALDASGARLSERRRDFDLHTQILSSVMLLRRGKLKTAREALPWSVGLDASTIRC